MREIVVRSISGILYVLVVVFSMYASRELFMILFLILGLQTLKEFKKLIHLKHFIPYLLLPISLLLANKEAKAMTHIAMFEPMFKIKDYCILANFYHF